MTRHRLGPARVRRASTEVRRRHPRGRVVLPAVATDRPRDDRPPISTEWRLDHHVTRARQPQTRANARSRNERGQAPRPTEGSRLMFVVELALVSELGESEISHRYLTRVAAALQKQVARDFAPLWGVRATVDAFVALDDVPVGYWPIIVERDIDMPGASGVHLDQEGQPF